MQAAALASARERSISHRSAAFLLGIGERSPARHRPDPDRQGGRKIDGIRSHGVAFPGGTNWSRCQGSSARVWRGRSVDLAGAYGEDGLRETFERAAAAGKLDLAAIEAVLDERDRKARGSLLAAGDRGVATGRGDGEVRDGAEPFRGEALAARREGRAADAARSTRRSGPRSASSRSTCSGTTQRFVVEADSRRHHATEVAFERDRKRDLELMEVHYEVLRVTWKQVEREPQQVFAVVRSELERRRRDGRRGAAA